MLDLAVDTRTAPPPPVTSDAPYSEPPTQRPNETQINTEDDVLRSSIGILLESFDDLVEKRLVKYRDAVEFVVDCSNGIKGNANALRVVAHAANIKGLHINVIKKALKFFSDTGRTWNDLVQTVNNQNALEQAMGDEQSMPHESKRLKFKLATFQQRLAQQLFNITASRNLSLMATMNTMATTLLMLKSRSTTPEDQASIALSMFFGANAQAALMRMFMDNGCAVFAPDPTIAADIAMMDLKGCDFVAIAPDGSLYLIDSKGRTHQAFDRPQVVACDLNPDVVNYVTEMLRESGDDGHQGVSRFLNGQGNPASLEIRLPAHPSFTGLGRIKPGYRDAFHSTVTNGIANPLYETNK